MSRENALLDGPAETAVPGVEALAVEVVLGVKE
jgi:hypothetical protein